MNLRKIEKIILGGGKLNQLEEDYFKGRVKDYWEHHPDVETNFPKWKKSIAWVAGYQTYDYNRALGKTMPVPFQGKKKVVFNRLKVFVRTLLSKMSAEIHQASVIPITSDSDDIEAARLGGKVVEALKEKIGARNVEQVLKLWLIVLNRAYLRIFWNEEDSGITGYKQKEAVDEETGEPILDQETGQPVPTEAIEPITEEGDAGLEAANPFMCRNDPLYINRKKWRWFEYGEVVDAEVLEEKYNLENGTLKEESDLLETPWDLSIGSSGDISVTAPDKKETVMGRTTLKIDFWTPKIWAFIAGDELLDYGINEHKEIPFIRLEERLIPVENTEKGLALNDSIVRDGISIQREFNKFKTIISNAIERTSKMKILLPLNSLISKKQWNNEWGTFLDVNTEFGKPEQMKMDPMPAYVEMYLNDLEREFETAFSTHEASFGRLPERASHASGALVHILLEQDEVVLTPLLQVINDGLSEAWSFILKMVQDNYTVSRLLKHAGKNGEYSVVSFRGAQLKGNTDVKVSSQTGLPRSRIARTEYVMKMYEAKLISSQQTLELLEFGNAERIFEATQVHQNRARKENSLITNNPDIDPQVTPTWVYKLEDHIVHLPIHIEDRLSGRYEKYTENQKQALNAHIDATYNIILEMTRQQAMAQTPPPPPPEQGQEVTSEEPGAAQPPPTE